MGLVDFYKCKSGSVMLEMDINAPHCEIEGLEHLKANTSDGATEKHIPLVKLEGDTVVVRIGSVEHPMTPEHYIEWIYVKTTFGGTYVNLTHEDQPEARFKFAPEEVVSVFAYCNLHGLWKAAEPVLPNSFVSNDIACSAEFTDGCVDPLKNS